MKKREQPTSHDLVEATRHDPDFWLRACLFEVAETGNPYYVWTAIKVCIDHKKEFPDWLLVYLRECAERMQSDKATKAGDIRKVLPWIFGFPSVLDPTQRKRGPGNLLGHQPDRTHFAIQFAIRLEQGEQPLEAMRNACNDVFVAKKAEAEDKTLQRWLLKEFDLKEWPPVIEQWKTVTRKHFGSIAMLLDSHWTKSRETPP